MSLEELDGASGLAFATVTPLDGGCSWDTDPGAGDQVSVSIHRGTGDLQLVRELWTDGTERTIAGHHAWATDLGTWVELDGEVLTILPYLTGATVERISPVDLARTVGELVVPRLP
jgi:hypothetical protein